MQVLWKLFLLGSVVEGFKLKTHVYIANQARAGALKGLNGSRQVQLGLIKANITNRFVLEAIQDYPDIFRAGVLGPDCFPDLIAGQVFVRRPAGDVSVVDLDRASTVFDLKTRLEKPSQIAAHGQTLPFCSQPHAGS